MSLYESIPLSHIFNHVNNYDQNCVKSVAAQGIFSNRVIKKLKLIKILIFLKKKKLEHIELSKTKTHKYMKFYNFFL